MRARVGVSFAHSQPLRVRRLTLSTSLAFRTSLQRLDHAPSMLLAGAGKGLAPALVSFAAAVAAAAASAAPVDTFPVRVFSWSEDGSKASSGTSPALLVAVCVNAPCTAVCERPRTSQIAGTTICRCHLKPYRKEWYAAYTTCEMCTERYESKPPCSKPGQSKTVWNRNMDVNRVPGQVVVMRVLVELFYARKG